MPKCFFSILFISENDITTFDQSRHHIGWLLAVVPEVLPVIEVCRHSHAVLVGSFYRFQANISGTLRNGGVIPVQ